MGHTVTVEQNSPKTLSSSRSFVDQTLYVKEKYNLSNEAYHEMAMINAGMPRLNALLKTARTLDATSIIYSVAGKHQGVQQSLKECFKKKIRIYKDLTLLFVKIE